MYNMYTMAFLYGSIALIFSFFLTAIVRGVMRRCKIIDRPKGSKRKIHKKNIPLGGGLALFLTFFVCAGLAYRFGAIGTVVSLRTLIFMCSAGCIIMIGGILDDAKNLKAWQQIWFPIVAALIIAMSGIGPLAVTDPFGGTISLAYAIGTISLAHIVVFFWMFGMMFTTKFLDGLDGLVTGIVTIGSIMIFFLSRQTPWYQPEVAIVALIFAGACLGFLMWNWHPAKIFLGEGGSLFTGFMLGILAIISGGKIMTTLLVVGIPVLDVIRVLYLRWRRKQPLHVGDSEHLHFKLLHSGLSQKQAVLLLYAISFTFGVTALFLQSSEKLIAFAFLFVLMLLLGVWLQSGGKKRHIWNREK